MIDTLFGYLLYPKAIILLFTSGLVLGWVVFFSYTFKSNQNRRKLSSHIYYILYTLCLFLWILSNVYFHSGFLTYYPSSVAVSVAIFANLSVFIAFSSAYLFSCKLRSIISHQTISKWQYFVLACFSIFAFSVNFTPNLTVEDVIIVAPSQFVIKFGPYTQGFFVVLVMLSILTFANLLHLRKLTSKLGQTKTNYMLAGIAVFMISTGLIQLGFTYIFKDFSLTWLPPVLSISEMFFVGYALLARRFYSPRYLTYIALSIVTTVVLFSLPLLSLVFFLDSYNGIVITGLLCVFFGLILKKVYLVIKRVIAKLLYGSPYTLVEQILLLEHDFQYSTHTAIERLAELLNIPKEKLQLITNYHGVMYTDYFSEKNSVLVADEIDNEFSELSSKLDGKLGALYRKMHSSNTALVLPLFDRNASISHLLVSAHKEDGTLFSNEEISALQKIITKAQSYINANRRVLQSQALASSIAHEMRNSLAQVQLQFEELKTKIMKSESLENVFSSIDKGSSAVLRGRQLIDIILREVSNSSLRQESSSLNSIFQALSQALDNYSFESDHIRNRVKLHDGNDFIVSINDTLFNFVIFNLLRNAVYYFDAYPNSQIDIWLLSQEHENVVVFRDTGPGIEPELQNKIFEDFFTHDKSGGSGLGLGYCQRVMEAFEGRIECNSIVNEYTEFRLYFPIVAIRTRISTLPDVVNYRVIDKNSYCEGEQTKRFGKQPINISKKTILIVDDKEAQRALIKVYLEQLGVNVIQANNGEMAVDMFRSQHVDLVLMDIQMPKMNGFESSKLIKKISSSTPIVVLSGESSTHDLNRMKQLMDGRLEKPTTKKDLEKMIVRFLN